MLDEGGRLLGKGLWCLRGISSLFFSPLALTLGKGLPHFFPALRLSPPRAACVGRPRQPGRGRGPGWRGSAPLAGPRLLAGWGFPTERGVLCLLPVLHAETNGEEHSSSDIKCSTCSLKLRSHVFYFDNCSVWVFFFVFCSCLGRGTSRPYLLHALPFLVGLYYDAPL